MGSHFYNWIDYNGVTFSIELLEWGCLFSDFWGKIAAERIRFGRKRTQRRRVKEKRMLSQARGKTIILHTKVANVPECFYCRLKGNCALHSIFKKWVNSF